MSAEHLLTVELAPFNVPDGELLVATRYAGQVYAGVRVGGATEDRAAWIYSRTGLHKDASYEGFWAGLLAPLGIYARDLHVVGAAPADTPDSPDLFAAPSGTNLSLSWDFSENATGANAVGGVELRIYNALTGGQMFLLGSSVSAPATGAQGLSLALPQLNAGVYTIWLRYGAQTGYLGLPPDFEAITGLKANDPHYSWRDPVTGLVYQFVPAWGVGALPRSGALLDEFNDLKERGQVHKRPEWIGYVFLTDELGKAVLQHTEWSMVRLLIQNVAATLAWPDESSISAGACPGAPLLKLQGGALVAVPLRSSMRSVGALKEIDGRLLVGAMEAGKNGRYASIIETGTLLDADTDAARGQTVTERRWCECALLNETVQSLARYPDNQDGAIFGATSCELFERVDYLPPGKRLVGSEPGGRSLALTHAAGAGALMLRAVESDFSSNTASWPSYSYVVVKTALGQKTGAGVQALYNSVLWEWNGRVWGIAGADPDLWASAQTSAQQEKALSYQCLAHFNGASWTKVARWPKSLYFYSRGAACGASMLLFGRRESDKRPVCGRFDGSALYTGVELPYYVERAETALSSDGKKEVVLMCGLKADPTATDNTVLPGFFLAETDGRFVGEVSPPGGGTNDPPHDADEALTDMPPGTVVYCARYNVETQTLFFAVTDALGTSGAALAATYPCLWARGDGAAPLPDFVGDPSPAVRAIMKEFDQRMMYGRHRAMPKPVKKWLDVIVLVAPGYTWSTVIQPF